MTQDYELVVKGVRNFENKVTVTVALQDKERFDGEIFGLDVAMDRVEGAARARESPAGADPDGA